MIYGLLICAYHLWYRGRIPLWVSMRRKHYKAYWISYIALEYSIVNLIRTFCEPTPLWIYAIQGITIGFLIVILRWTYKKNCKIVQMSQEKFQKPLDLERHVYYMIPLENRASHTRTQINRINSEEPAYNRFHLLV